MVHYHPKGFPYKVELQISSWEEECAIMEHLNGVVHRISKRQSMWAEWADTITVWFKQETHLMVFCLSFGEYVTGSLKCHSRQKIEADARKAALKNRKEWEKNHMRKWREEHKRRVRDEKRKARGEAVDPS